MSEGTRKLHRSKTDRWLAGVCGGIAEYFNIDGTLVRVLFILFGFAVGGGILIYIILWIIMPEAPNDLLDDAGAGDLKLEDEPVSEPETESADADAPKDEADTQAIEE